MLSGALIILTIVDLVVALINGDTYDINPVDYYTPSIKIATFVS